MVMQRFALLLLACIVVCPVAGCTGQRAASQDRATLDFVRVEDLREAIRARYRELVPTIGEEAARQEVVRWLRLRSDIRDAGLRDDGVRVWVVTTAGAEFEVVLM